MNYSGLLALLSFAVAWTASQTCKFLLEYRGSKKNGFWREARRSLKSGGMPSGHSASFAGLATFVGLVEGINSTIFALAVAVYIIVVYDSLNVRQAVGLIGEAIEKAVKKGTIDEAPKIVRGHKMMEVVAGTIIGVTCGILLFLAFQQR